MTGKLMTESNFDHPDDFYQASIEMHDGLTPAESLLANAKLILLLANHIGDADVIREAMTAARKGLGGGGQ
jgi:uncharacterized protein DUF2783